MKKQTLLLAMLLTIGLACSKKEDPQSGQNGCVTGIPNGGGSRTMIDCAKKSEINKSSMAPFYHDLKWELCASCK